jgi:hypothetical protein
MNDRQVRTALLRRLSARFSRDPNTLILEEFGIGHGSTRVDVAVINGRMHGFELKSDKDTLDRLPHQVHAFSSVFDRVTLVVGYRHAYEALQIIPEWWGVKLAEEKENGGVQLSEARGPRNNPAVDPISVAELLWREEALNLLQEFGAAEQVRSRPRGVIYQKLVQTISVAQLQELVRKQLRTRTTWRVDAPHRSNDD